MNELPYSKIIIVELFFFILSLTIGIISGLFGFSFYPFIFLFSGTLLGSIATFGYVRIKRGMIR